MSSEQTVRRVFAGVDGGGTGTRLRLTDENGTVLGVGEGGRANIATDPHVAWASICTALDQALARAELDEFSLHWAFGLAGAEVSEKRQLFLEMTPSDLPRPIVVTDAYTACLGAHDGKDGTIIVVGTGSVGYAIRSGADGVHTRRVGGWGFPQGDEGSGAWIGREVLAAMLRAHDGRRAPDALSKACWDYLQQEADPLAWGVNKRGGDFARLAPLAIRQAEEGCIEAQRLLSAAAREVEILISALIDAPGFSDLPICGLGSLTSILMTYFDESRKYVFNAPLGDAVDGALLLVHRAMNDRK
ncbi:hypothetical protein A0U90_05835 [Kozakia baliensis]|nr:hypothetical protein A0U90_05835 [Kozakia baliensis]